MTPPLVQVNQLTIADLAGRPIVDGVSLEIEAGSVLGLVGESGCGKTTLSLAMLGYTRQGLKHEAGEVMVDNYNMLGSPSHRGDLRGSTVSYVPQDPGTALNPVMRLGAQLDEMLSVHASHMSKQQRAQRIAEVLHEMDLSTEESWLRRYPHQLSGGQQQRVAIAMAFLNQARLVVMDEPTTGLDVSTQARVLDLVRRLCARTEAAVVYVTHDLAVVSSLAPKIAVMYAGRLVEAGPTADVLNKPCHPYTRALLAAVPDLEQPHNLTGIPGQAPSPTASRQGCSYAPRCPLAAQICRHGEVPERHVSQEHSAWCHFATPEAAIRRLPTTRVERRDAPTALLEVRGLNASYAGREVVHDANFTVLSGQCLALVGESGSGKTTLARSIAGIHREYEGVVELNGLTLAKQARERTPEQRRQVQYIFQNPYASLNPRRTIRQSLQQPLRELGSVDGRPDEEVLAEATQRVSLPLDLLDRLPHQLSGGQRQRVAIARALIPGPQVLVCDEVTSALDVSIQAVIVNLLNQLRREGLSLIFVTHNLALVPNVAQEVAVLQRGRLIELGPCAQVLSHPRNKETQDLLTAVPRLQAWG